MAVQIVRGVTTLAQKVFEFPGRFPYLERALHDAKPAHSAKTEWIIDRLIDSDVRKEVEFNYQQIFRNFSLEQLLGDIESCLAGSQAPQLDATASHVIGSLGGFGYYVKKFGLRQEDVSTGLRVLRDLVQYPEGDWIVELSLIVWPGQS